MFSSHFLFIFLIQRFDSLNTRIVLDIECMRQTALPENSLPNGNEQLPKRNFPNDNFDLFLFTALTLVHNELL